MDLDKPAQYGSAYSFLDFKVDLSTERLLRGSDEIKLRPKSFHVLSYMIEHHGRLVTREELLRAVWDDVVVTDESVTKCITEIRKALSDESQEIIRTVHKRGFVFQADVHPVRIISLQLGELMKRCSKASRPENCIHFRLR
jgi:DNA-binding winged helix-turn-helix (wHTH) protein